MFKRTRGISTTDLATKLLKIHDSLNQTTEQNEEFKQGIDLSKSKVMLPSVLGSYNVNIDFLASARRIAQFANTRDPAESDKIVYLDGSFDLFRPGHIEQLAKAKKLGNYLIVGIHEDQCVNQYLGEHYPLNTLHERVLNVLSCRYVDDVIIGAPFKITETLIKDLNPSVIVKSLDFCSGLMREEAEALKPYEVPDKTGISHEFDSSCKLTMRIIAERVAINRDAIENKVKVSKTRMAKMGF